MFEIRFQGLLTHALVEDSTAKLHQRVVLYTVPAMKHSALLTVHKDDLISPAADFPNGDARCFRIKGVCRTNLAAGIPSKSLKGVISLKDENVSGKPSIVKTPVKDIRDFKATANFSLFEVPDGTMYIRNWFIEWALFNGVLFPGPRTVALTTSPSADIKFTIDDQAGATRDIMVKKTATYVYITNAPIDPSHVSMPHWEAMSVFFDQTVNNVKVANPVKVTTPMFPLGAADDIVDKCVEPQQLGVECANSQFP